MANRAGKMVENYSGEVAYQSFYPQPLPPEPNIEIDADMQKLLTDAHKKLALLDGISDRIPNKDLFISMCVRKEALVSSQIEGTQCTLEDVLDPGIDENSNRGIAETAKDANETITRLCELHAVNADKLTEAPTRSRKNLLWLLEYIERNPIINTIKTADALGLSRNGTANYIAALCDMGILRSTAKSGKTRIFSYEEYLKILRKDT